MANIIVDPVPSPGRSGPADYRLLQAGICCAVYRLVISSGSTYRGVKDLLAVCPLGDIYSLSVSQQQTLMQATPCGLSELITVVGRGWAPVSVLSQFYIVKV